MEMERALDGVRSADDAGGMRGMVTMTRHQKEGLEEDRGDSHSSLDFHTPLPYVFFFVGFLIRALLT